MRVLALSFVVLVTGACRSGTDVKRLPPIDNSDLAEFVANDLATLVLQLRAELENGTYTNESFVGNTGAVAISGSASYESNVSCGTDCVESVNNTSLTMAFSGYTVNTADNTTTTLSGTIRFTDNRWSRQQGLGYTSGGQLCLSSQTALDYRLIGDAGTSTEFGYSDTIKSLSACGGPQSISGTLTTASGEFSF